MDDSLARYRQKRDFSRTKEPAGEKPEKPSKALSYVIQKHEASHLHYDFRLELDGVLLSWAVPKGPSLDPAVRRLAMQVEDHPVAYGPFEGTIPEGEYGGGTVMVWDRGSWEPHHDPHASLKKGHLSFELHGERLKGGFHLIRTAADAQGRARWLLAKIADKTAKTGPKEITERFVKSVKTGRSMAEIAAGDDVWSSKPKTAKAKAAPKAKAPPKAKAKAKAKSKMPEILEPQLATLVDSPPEGDDWVHEVKLDGYRLLAHVEDGSVVLRTRRGHDWTARFPTLAHELAKLPGSALLDGELVAFDPKKKGSGDFQRLQNSLEEGKDKDLVYVAFDLVHRDDKDLRDAPLVERKAALATLIEEAKLPHVVLSPHVGGEGGGVLAIACERHLEGIVSKRLDSTYVSGRGKAWVKSKCLGRQELVIGGFTAPRGGRSHLGALLVGERVGKELKYAGKVGTGFTDRSLTELSAALAPLVQKDQPFVGTLPSEVRRGVTWVAPKLVCEVQFTERTREGIMRHPSFQGLRLDKPAEEVVRELPASKVTHPDRVVYPDVGITKGEVAAYYDAVAQRMLPYVQHRPLTLVRCPGGVGKPHFFQKHANADLGPGLERVPLKEGEDLADFFAISDVGGFAALVQMNALELHTWGSHGDDAERPDLLVIDLDPDESVAWKHVVEAAREVRETLREASLESFVKTTGGKGLHICVPITPSIDWDTAKTFTHALCDALVKRAPDRYLANMSKAKRKGKIFLDYLRNGRGATFVAPYSTRARAGATVAMPIAWDDLTPSLAPADFTVKTAPKRIAKDGDPWASMLTTKQRIPAAALRAIGAKVASAKV